MTARTHDLAAFTALGIVAITTLNIQITLGTALIAVLANQLGGIAPDIDQPTAPFWRNLPVGGYFGKVIDKMLGGHRFLSHSIIGAAGFGFLGWFILKFLHPIMPHVNIGIVWWAFMIGLLSHLVMDTFTKEGVPWLLPIPVKLGLPPVKSLRITTGKNVEKALFIAILAFDVWYCSSHYAELLTLLHSQII
ncbi:MAG TPA: metal-dependent hydrolase [Patescibacteria group bacterium]|nr:metal-dependent hydrolase [Patescibacteria group bacterium]